MVPMLPTSGTIRRTRNTRVNMLLYTYGVYFPGAVKIDNFHMKDFDNTYLYSKHRFW